MRLINSNRHPHRGLLKFFAACLLLYAPLAKATVYMVPIEVSDQDLLSDGTTRWVGSPSSRVGLGYNTTTPSVYVMPFKLPQLAPGEQITSAKLSVNIEGWNNLSSYPLRNVDLYGIGRVSISNAAKFPEDFVDGINPGTNTMAFSLQDNFIIPADIPGTSGSGASIPKLSEDFGWFIQALYNDGALPGQYGFLTLTHDAALTLMRYYILTSADSQTLTKPYVIITAGKSYYLDATLGSDQNDGSAASPWQTFNFAQSQLQPGDTLYCTGELGQIDMYTSTGPNGELPYKLGTAVEQISYKRWEGKTQPHITQLIFHGSTYSNTKRDTYLSFEGFLFYPGKVDKGNYDTNNAINLKGAWYITFTDCDIQGASLDVSDDALPIDPAERFSPYVPSSPASPTAPQDKLYTNPAITAGTPGNASYVIIQNCRISNAGIGIMVADNASYYPPYTYPQQSTHWQILGNDISNISEDGLRFAGGIAGAYSTVSGNTIRDQNYNQSVLTWPGYIYKNNALDPTALDGKKWKRVRQVRTDGTIQTGIIYHVAKITDSGVLGDIYMRLFILADSRNAAPIRSMRSSWVLEEDPTIEFRPFSKPVLQPDGTISPGTTAASGDSAHTDCISIMGQMTGGFFEKNECRVSEWGGHALKLDNVAPTANPPPHPTDLIFENNLFYSTSQPEVGAFIINIAGGKNCWFKHNTIFGGPYYNLAGALRFDGNKMTQGPGMEGVHFRNNIIAGGGTINTTNGLSVATSDYNFWIQPPNTTTPSGIQAGPNDRLPPLGTNGRLLPKEQAIARVGFLNASTGDLRINQGSPAQNSLLDLGLPDDFNDFPRADGLPDMGAFEVGSQPPQITP